MRDFNRVIGLLFNHHNDTKGIKKVFVELASKVESDDLVIVGDLACQGPGETTGAVANSKLPLSTEKSISFLKNLAQLGDFECACEKCIFIVSDKFNEELKFNIKKLIKMNNQKHYGIRFHIFNLGKDELSEEYIKCDFDTMKEKLFSIFDELDQVTVEDEMPEVPKVPELANVEIPDVPIDAKLEEKNVCISLLDTYCPSCKAYVAGHQVEELPQLTCHKCKYSWRYGEEIDEANQL